MTSGRIKRYLGAGAALLEDGRMVTQMPPPGQGAALITPTGQGAGLEQPANWHPSPAPLSRKPLPQGSSTRYLTIETQGDVVSIEQQFRYVPVSMRDPSALFAGTLRGVFSHLGITGPVVFSAAGATERNLHPYEHVYQEWGGTQNGAHQVNTTLFPWYIMPHTYNAANPANYSQYARAGIPLDAMCLDMFTFPESLKTGRKSSDQIPPWMTLLGGEFEHIWADFDRIESWYLPMGDYLRDDTRDWLKYNGTFYVNEPTPPEWTQANTFQPEGWLWGAAHYHLTGAYKQKDPVEVRSTLTPLARLGMALLFDQIRTRTLPAAPCPLVPSPHYPDGWAYRPPWFRWDGDGSVIREHDAVISVETAVAVQVSFVWEADSIRLTWHIGDVTVPLTLTFTAPAVAYSAGVSYTQIPLTPDTPVTINFGTVQVDAIALPFWRENHERFDGWHPTPNNYPWWNPPTYRSYYWTDAQGRLPWATIYDSYGYDQADPPTNGGWQWRILGCRTTGNLSDLPEIVFYLS